MRTLGRRLFASALVVGGLSLAAAVAQACPMCSQSIAEEDLLPHAYMYSILFMLGMPATVFTGFGTMLYFKFRKFNATQPATELPAEFAPNERASPACPRSAVLDHGTAPLSGR